MRKHDAPNYGSLACSIGPDKKDKPAQKLAQASKLPLRFCKIIGNRHEVSGDQGSTSVVQVFCQLLPSVVTFCQLPGAAAAVGQLGVASTHECDQRIGYGVDRNRTFP
ncbi:MAG: hypothetical protein ACKOEI_00220, partial [Chthoniobacterales bacterium]